MAESGAGSRERRERGAHAGPPHQRAPHVQESAPSDDAVVALLAQLAPLTAPDETARARMRETVLAGLNGHNPAEVPRPARRQRAARAPRGRREATGPGDAARPAPDDTHAARARRGGARGRFAVAAVAALTLVFALGGMSLLLARDALPGDPLYGVKRTGEAASLGLTFGDEDRAAKRLEFAAARLTELETLVNRHPNPQEAPVGTFLTAFGDFDNDASAGARGLIALGTSGDGAHLGTLATWARQQGTRLDAIRSRLPDGANAAATVTTALLTRITSRATDLSTRLPCDQITSSDHDDIGPLPAASACAQDPATRVPPSGAQPDPRQATVPPPAPESTPTQPGISTQAAPPTPTTPGTPGTGPTGTASTPPGTPSPGTTQPPANVPAPLPLPTIDVAPVVPGLLPGLRLG